MLDRTRLVVEKRLGTDPVDPNTTFEEGDLLHWSADGWTLSADGTAVVIRGIAGLNKSNILMGNAINEAVVLEVEDDVNLSHANLLADSAKVTSEDGLTTYTETTDYLLNDLNGVISRVALGSIGDGDTVLVTYTYQRTQDEIQEEIGSPLSNNQDETFGSGNIVVLQGRMTVATSRYDTSQDYAVNAPLYDKGDGLLTSDDSGSVIQVGNVKGSPSASDAFLIAELTL